MHKAPIEKWNLNIKTLRLIFMSFIAMSTLAACDDSGGEMKSAINKGQLEEPKTPPPTEPPVDPNAPPPVVLSAPTESTISSNASSLTFSGSCIAGNSISIIETSTESVAIATCSAEGTFSHTVNPTADGVLNYAINQINSENLASIPVTVTWTRDTIAPIAPVIASPTSPVLNNLSSITINGSCEDGALVRMTGDASDSSLCSSSSFSFSVTKSVDGTFVFGISQTDAVGNASASSTLTWNRDTVLPDLVTITSPASSPFTSNQNSLTISGACEPGATVLGMNQNNSENKVASCAAGTYSMNFTVATDASYNFSLRQRDPANNLSAIKTQTWVRDATPPSAPVITSTINAITNTNNLIITGSCESGATVNISGAHSGAALCASSAFSFNVNKLSDALYNFNFTQTDGVGNTSTASTSSWKRDTVAPGLVSILSPVSNPYTSNQNSITISGLCEEAATVTATNQNNSQSQNATCTGSAYTFTFSVASDASYNIAIKQRDQATNESANQFFVWNRDATPPAAPAITSPLAVINNQNSITITGNCENGALVSVSGSASDSMICSANNFSFTINKASDGNYAFALTQSDAGGNVSSAANVTWTRDTVAPALVVISNPPSPHISNTNSITLSGTCESLATVNVLNTSDSSVESAVCAGSVFSIGLSNTIDSTLNYQVTQIDQAGNISSVESYSWTRDTVAPATPVITSPSSPVSNNANSITINGVCETGANVGLSGDESNSSICAAGSFSFTINKAVNGTYNFYIAQTDAAGNSSSNATLQWNRNALSIPSPVVASPSSPHHSNQNSVALNGTCDAAATQVNVLDTSDSSNQLVACSSGVFNATLNSNIDGTRVYQITAKDNSGNESGFTSFTWIRDTVAPSAPVISSPLAAVNNSANSLNITGSCETNATVTLSGSSADSVLCAANAFSFVVNKSTDGNYSFSIGQTDLAGNSSTTATVLWNRDSSAPLAPIIVSPLSPYLSNGSSVTVSGSCESFATVKIFDVDASQTSTTACSSSSFSINLSTSTDGSKLFNFTQVDLAGNESLVTQFTWNRDTTPPSVPNITSHASPFTSGSNSLVLSGTCEVSSTVAISGDFADSQSCASGSFSFTINKASDATYNFNLNSTDAIGNTSGNSSFTWILDASAPSVPTITNHTSPYHTSTNSILVSGTCETNSVVKILDVDASTFQTQTCVSSAFSFTLNYATDGSHQFVLTQTDGANNVSGDSNFTWVRDTVAPAAPSISSPANPFTSGGDNVNLVGGCEADASIAMSGSATANTTCASGSFNFDLNKTSDGVYNFDITQSDLAGNTSAVTTFTWTRSTAVPSAPTITTPASNPLTTNVGTVIISGACTSTYPVTLAGDILASEVSSPSNSLSQICSSGSYSFTFAKASSATYNFDVFQTNPTTSISSSSVTLTLHLDMDAPAQPVITSPDSSPYVSPTDITMAGTCENDTTVNLSGDSTQSQACIAGGFSFYVNIASDGTYNFSISQTDAAGNVSSSASMQWNRVYDSVVPPTISAPASNPYTSNNNTLSLSGACTTGYTVLLSGDVLASEVTTPANSLSVVCAGNAYQFVITKGAPAGTYNLNLKQRFMTVDSSAASFQWQLDTIAPTISITVAPPSPNFKPSGVFEFSANEAVTFQCAIDGGAYTSCSSPFDTGVLSNASHTVTFKATDGAGNISTLSSSAWTQMAYNTLALFHLDTASPTADSSLFSSPYNNPLTDVSSTANATGKFAQGRTLGASKYLFAPNSATLQANNSVFTAEGWFSFSAMPSSATNYFTLFSKTGGANNLSWELRLYRGTNTTRYKLQLFYSTDGVNYLSTTATANITVTLNSWVHFAVTYNAGAYVICSQGTSRSSGTLTGTSVFNSTGDFKIGANMTSGTAPSEWMTGSVDEVRFTQTPIYSSTNCAAPTAVFTAN